MNAIMLMDLANVSCGLRDLGYVLDPINTYRNLLGVEGLERIVGMLSFGEYATAHFPKPFQRNLMAAGFQLIQCPRLDNLSADGKSTDDDELLMQAHWLLNEGLNFDTVFLVTGDRNFLRVAQRYMNAGKKVILVNPNLLSASHDLRNAIGQEIELLALINLVSPEPGPVVEVAEISTSDVTSAPAPESINPPQPLTVPCIELVGNPNPTELELMYYLIGCDSIEQIGEILDHSESDPTLRWAATLDEFYRALEILLMKQESMGLPSAFSHLLNVLSNPESFTSGKIPLLPNSELSEKGWSASLGFEVPDWVSELGRTGVMDVLNMMLSTRLLKREMVSAYGGAKDVNSVYINRDHLFAIAHAQKEQGVPIKELALSD